VTIPKYPSALVEKEKKARLGKGGGKKIGAFTNHLAVSWEERKRGEVGKRRPHSTFGRTSARPKRKTGLREKGKERRTTSPDP